MRIPRRQVGVARALNLALLGAAVGCGGHALEPVMPDPGPPEFDSRIVPGKRIGPIALGASGPALEKTLGPPERSSPSTSGSGKTWRGVTADISDDTQRVMSVYTEDATYTTDGGVHSGSSEEALRGAL